MSKAPFIHWEGYNDDFLSPSYCFHILAGIILWGNASFRLLLIYKHTGKVGYVFSAWFFIRISRSWGHPCHTQKAPIAFISFLLKYHLMSSSWTHRCNKLFRWISAQCGFYSHWSSNCPICTLFNWLLTPFRMNPVWWQFPCSLSLSTCLRFLSDLSWTHTWNQPLPDFFQWKWCVKTWVCPLQMLTAPGLVIVSQLFQWAEQGTKCTHSHAHTYR